MPSYSNHTIIGNMTKDPTELKTVGQNNTPMTVLNVAVNREMQREGQPEADFYKVTVFGNNAKWLSENLKTGDCVTATGWQTLETWEKQDGTTGFTLALNATKVKRLIAKNHDGGQGSEPAPLPRGGGRGGARGGASSTPGTIPSGVLDNPFADE